MRDCRITTTYQSDMVHVRIENLVYDVQGDGWGITEYGAKYSAMTNYLRKLVFAEMRDYSRNRIPYNDYSLKDS